MNTVHQPPDNDTDPLPDPPPITPYFLRCAAVLEAVELEKARRCLLPAA